MTSHERICDLLALGTAGLLDPADERKIREHLRGCAECARRAEEFASLSAGLTTLPAPPLPPGLALRTQSWVAAELAANADRRQGAILAVAAGALAWAMTMAAWYCYRMLAGGSNLGWLLWSLALVWMAVPPVAGLLESRRRLQRSMR